MDATSIRTVDSSQSIDEIYLLLANVQDELTINKNRRKCAEKQKKIN